MAGENIGVAKKANGVKTRKLIKESIEMSKKK
jgi:hypothetical protein